MKEKTNLTIQSHIKRLAEKMAEERNQSLSQLFENLITQEEKREIVDSLLESEINSGFIRQMAEMRKKIAQLEQSQNKK